MYCTYPLCRSWLTFCSCVPKRILHFICGNPGGEKNKKKLSSLPPRREMNIYRLLHWHEQSMLHIFSLNTECKETLNPTGAQVFLVCYWQSICQWLIWKTIDTSLCVYMSVTTWNHWTEAFVYVCVCVCVCVSQQSSLIHSFFLPNGAI